MSTPRTQDTLRESRVALFTGASAASRRHPIVVACADALTTNGFEIRREDRLRPSSVIAGQNPSDVIVAVVDSNSRPCDLVGSAILARRHAAPLIVIEVTPGTLRTLRSGRAIKFATNRTITRVMTPDDLLSAEGGIDPSVLTGMGLGRLLTSPEGPVALTLRDIDEVVQIHLAAFHESAMTLLGASVVERYYRWQFIGAHPSPYAAGFYMNGSLAGFLFQGQRHDASSGFALRFLPTIIAGCISHPKGARALFGPELMKVLRIMARRNSPAPAVPPKVSSEAETLPTDGGAPTHALLSLAVHPNNQGSGVGAALLNDAERIALERGFERMRLTVDVDNHRAFHVYEREGWQRVITETGAWEGRMIKVIGETKAPQP